MAHLIPFEDLRPKKLFEDTGSDDGGFIAVDIQSGEWSRPRYPEKMHGLEFDCPICRSRIIDNHHRQPDFFVTGEKPSQWLRESLDALHRLRIWQVPTEWSGAFLNLSGHTLYRLTVLPQIVIHDHHMRIEIADGTVFF